MSFENLQIGVHRIYICGMMNLNKILNESLFSKNLFLIFWIYLKFKPALHMQIFSLMAKKILWISSSLEF